MVILWFIKSFTYDLLKKSHKDGCFDGFFSTIVHALLHAKTTLCLILEEQVDS